jgi:hypothetical protein
MIVTPEVIAVGARAVSKTRQAEDDRAEVKECVVTLHLHSDLEGNLIKMFL